MAEYHVRAGLPDGNGFEVLYHIPVPDVNNRAGVNARVALIKSGLGGTTKMAEGIGAGMITAAEKTQIENGELFEYSESVATNPVETAAQLQDRLDARYTELVSIVQNRLSKRLTYWGYDRDI